MAYFKYGQLFKHLENKEFDVIREPGTPAGWSGIYSCEGCGREAVSTQGHSYHRRITINTLSRRGLFAGGSS
jgi:hypothetical protein